jgi:trans-2,3-dihydro-3-hydroxyanthranilate isomerase
MKNEANKFYIVDVFAEKKYSGNQLAVVNVSKSLSDNEMLLIAKEMNYSETSFILSGNKECCFEVRIFTPEREVPFAGHPVLGTAYVIQQIILAKPANKITLKLKSGKITVTFSTKDDLLWMKQKNPEFGETLQPDSIAAVLGLLKDDIDKRFPIEEVSTGFPFIIVPLKNLDSLKRARISGEKYFEFIEKNNAKAILIFSPEPYDKKNDLSVRVFADYYGIAEDPATGSANGALAGYLIKRGYYKNQSINIRVEQGHEIGRPSLLYLKANSILKEIEIFVGGKVIMVANGSLC